MEIPRHWRLKGQRYRLEGLTCPNCGQLMFPQRPVCAECQWAVQPLSLIDLVLPNVLTSLNLTEVASPINCGTLEKRMR